MADLTVYKNTFILEIVDDQPGRTSGRYRFELPEDAHRLASIAVVQGLYDGLASWNRPPAERSEHTSRQACTHRLESYAEPDEDGGEEGTNDLPLFRQLFTSAYRPARRSVYRLLASDWRLAAQLGQLSQDALVKGLSYYVAEHHEELTHILDQDQVIELPLPFLIVEDE